MSFHSTKVKSDSIYVQRLIESQEEDDISNIRKLKANFCGHEKEGHFHSKNFLRALK